MAESEHLLSGCLYFSANKFVRLLSKIAEEEFKTTGLSPTYAFAVAVINKFEGISSTELAEYLHMAPSTITRFVDKLVSKELAQRKIEGKNTFIFPTEKSKELQSVIDSSWESLGKVYAKKLGQEYGKNLACMLNEASKKL